MADARQFNIRDDQGKLLCPACGFPEYVVTDAYDEAGGIPMGIRPCCLWEPGFDDKPAASSHAKDTIFGSLQSYRAEWSAAPAWRGHGDLKPTRWNASAQMTHLLSCAPYVR
jgi:hypothetical protein